MRRANAINEIRETKSESSDARERFRAQTSSGRAGKARALESISFLALRLALLCLLTANLALLAGCSARTKTVTDTFPKGRAASPWVLRGEVWSGSAEDAAQGLGNEAESIKSLGPDHVWLAVYDHENRGKRTMTVRAYSFESDDASQRAYDRLRPSSAKSFTGGSASCWTNDGLLIRWGRMLFDLFGSNPQDQAGPEQAVYLWAFVERAMPRGLPENPR